MKRILLAIGLLFAASSANAACGVAGAGNAQFYDGNGAACVSSAIAGSVPAVTGHGTLAVTNASALLSTVTLGPNSAAWSTAGMVYVINASGSAGVAYVCPLGGTCPPGTGIPIAPGASYGFYKPATTMTVIAATTASVSAQW